MRKRALLVVTALLAGAAWVAGPTPPAGAAVTVTSSGTSITATITGSGHGTVGVSCVGGQARVLNVPATPSVACAALTSITFTTDSNANAFGPPYPFADFPALTQSTINAGSGADRIELSTKREVVNAGGGGDTITVPWGGADDSVSMGGQTDDRVAVVGSTAADVATLSSPGSGITRLTSGSWDLTVTAPRTVVLIARGGNDVIGAAGLPATAGLARLEVDGQAGDDTIVCGAVSCSIDGGDGTNVLTGGSVGDSITSTSTTDTIRGNGGGDGLNDRGPRAFGARAIDSGGNGASTDSYLALFQGDAYVRVRPNGSTGASLWAGLARTGRQDLDAGIGTVNWDVHQESAPADRVVVDATPLASQYQVVDGTSGTALDIVVPSGSWTTSSGQVTFSSGARAISYSGGVTVNVRSPYTNADESFAHRVIRDLYLRIPTGPERVALRDQLTAGTTTRAAAVLSRTSTDGYRGLAVDRAFVDILRRTTDLDGRSYWIGRLRDGLVIRRLRANLYGSNEYFSDAGNTPKLYVAAAYRDILGRTATQTDIDYWAAQITEVGLPRGTVADRFLNTPEARRVVIRDLFVRWALREPTAGEVSTWSPQLGSSSTDGEVALTRFLAGSATYYLRPDA